VAPRTGSADRQRCLRRVDGESVEGEPHAHVGVVDRVSGYRRKAFAGEIGGVDPLPFSLPVGPQQLAVGAACGPTLLAEA